MAFGKATGAFEKVLRPIMSNDGVHLADVTLKGSLSKKTRTGEDIIKLIRAIATDSVLPEVKRLPITNFHHDEKKPSTLHLKTGIGENNSVAEIAFKNTTTFTDDQMAIFMNRISNQAPEAPKPKNQKNIPA